MKRFATTFILVLSTTAIVTTPAALAWDKPVRATQRCGTFSGSVSLNQAQTQLAIAGTVHNSCRGGQTSVWMSWDVGVPLLIDQYHNAKEAVAAPLTSVRINPRHVHSILLANPGYITVTVCSNYEGWHCGRPVGL